MNLINSFSHVSFIDIKSDLDLFLKINKDDNSVKLNLRKKQQIEINSDERRANEKDKRPIRPTNIKEKQKENLSISEYLDSEEDFSSQYSENDSRMKLVIN